MVHSGKTFSFWIPQGAKFEGSKCVTSEGAEDVWGCGRHRFQWRANPVLPTTICWKYEHLWALIILRFVTGSSVCLSCQIQVTFNNLKGIGRRPIAHTHHLNLHSSFVQFWYNTCRKYMCKWYNSLHVICIQTNYRQQLAQSGLMFSFECITKSPGHTNFSHG